MRCTKINHFFARARVKSTLRYVSTEAPVFEAYDIPENTEHSTAAKNHGNGVKLMVIRHMKKTTKGIQSLLDQKGAEGSLRKLKIRFPKK